ncbi:MAG TPA: hypothetical protein GXZ70_06320 [Clostridiales bacterium]|nr:hypothetical protein [Clostridiales bacterium]
MGREPLAFTFEDLDREHDYFNLSRVGREWFIHFLDTLQKLSKKTWPEIQQDNYYNVHPHDWNKTTTRFRKEKYEQYEGVQFSLGSNYGRVHGYIIGNLFFIVWLDKYHNLYDMEGHTPAKSKVKIMKDYPSVSCLQIHNAEIKILADKISKLEEQNKKLKNDIELYENYNSELEQEIKNLRNENTNLKNSIDNKKKKQQVYNEKIKRRKNRKKK